MNTIRLSSLQLESMIHIVSVTRHRKARASYKKRIRPERSVIDTRAKVEARK